MKYLVAVLVLMMASVASAQVIQFTTERDAEGKWTNWAEIAGTWEDSTAPTGDHIAFSTQNLQIWRVQFAAAGWKRVSFNITDAYPAILHVHLLEYAVRASSDGVLWSLPNSLVVVRPVLISG